MTGPIRSSSFGDLSVVSAELEPLHVGEGEVPGVSVLAVGDEADRPLAVAIATLKRPRRSLDDQLWVQLFVDEVFVDVVRALEVGREEDDDGVFVAHVRLPSTYVDGRPHSVHARFVTAVSVVVPRGEAERIEARTEQVAPTAARAEFTAATSQARGRARANG